MRIPSNFLVRCCRVQTRLQIISGCDEAPKVQRAGLGPVGAGARSWAGNNGVRVQRADPREIWRRATIRAVPARPGRWLEGSVGKEGVDPIAPRRPSAPGSMDGAALGGDPRILQQHHTWAAICFRRTHQQLYYCAAPPTPREAERRSVLQDGGPGRRERPGRVPRSGAEQSRAEQRRRRRGREAERQRGREAERQRAAGKRRPSLSFSAGNITRARNAHAADTITTRNGRLSLRRFHGRAEIREDCLKRLLETRQGCAGGG
ncbi:hypothetical protein B0J12DRAFT_395053 [Macrophomina phaseolina]|uniref:Uncharacterized protein n=1 Tax=Macrophomina phaseolina TaxID=35725 RepID=A0ABQ8FSG9_9PEZI|nr:hypothetical protein B0J12DRAFT_395053 [Macrophomina phaseolina]